jgi:AcrR family transcriptional regulator
VESSQVPDLEPRKVPRQARSRATFDAILEACARLLARGDGRVTTNQIAESAGVSIGTLYEFFPNRESILAALGHERLARLEGEVSAALEAALSLDEGEALGLLIRRIIAAISADRALYRTLLREEPALRALPQTRRLLATLFDLGRGAGERARHRVRLPHLPVDSWLIGRMVANGALEIAFLEDDAPDRELLVGELIRLTFRMLHARDLERDPAAIRAPRRGA